MKPTYRQVLVLCSCLGTSLPFLSAAQARPIGFDLPRQPVADAILAYGRQANVRIVLKADTANGVIAHPVKGVLEPEAALSALLLGTGLQSLHEPDGTILIESAAHSPDAAGNPHKGGGQRRADAGAAESVIVLGAGHSRQVQILSRAELRKSVPGTSPLATLSELPGVNFQSSDPLGAYEWAQQITVRGFITDQLGYTLDGVPLGNMQYRNNNGLSIGRALENENNGPVTLAQGAGALGTASTSNLGGTIQFTSIDPSDHYGVDVAGSVGSSDMWRTFVRVNTGILPGGGKAFVSYDYQFADKWKGWGQQKQQQLNIKYIQPLGSSVRMTTYLDLDDRREDDYLDLSKSLISRFGYNHDDISRNYGLAEDIARAVQNGTPIPAPYQTADDTYYRGGGVRQDVLGYGRLDYDISSRLSGATTVYGHHDRGPGTWTDPYDPTPAQFGGSPLSVSTTEYNMHREGVTTSLAYRFRRHRIEAGFWFEHNLFSQAAKLYPLQAGVEPGNFERFYENPFDVQWQYVFRTKVYQFHIGDTWRVTPKLRLNAGFKSLVSDSSARTVSSKNPINASISASNGFLPQAGALYTFDSHNEVFADFTRNMAAYTASASTGPFSTTQAGFDYVRGTLKPETTNTEEVGYRFHNAALQLSLTGYYVNFANRLLASSISSVIVGNQNVLENVGGVTSRGVEGAANWRFARNWSLYGTWSYNDAHYDDNVAVPGSTAVVPIKGKQVVAAPRNIGNVKLAYDDGTVWGQVSGQYQSRRFYTYLNDSPIKGRVIFNLAAGYRFHRQGWLNNLEAQVNVVNLFDKRYISSVGTTGFVNSDPAGTYQTLQGAPPRQVFFTLSKHFF
ncbi:TonB-dependent receptor [Gluconacetobacter johannae DSM 13595]|uniref:TonB-dependent receptor domain-containing protein n=1 Tax=Gluconacetobacter johannae TaxID=112140 RepID=UPI00215685A0|nr:TonB-dependent receptor [Gluconacetobacter johannae]GBQ81883.1 TonB-dependent receptor [Gluconacetobacter johannae DSM 13595]